MDILSKPALGGLIFAGGFGVRLKQEYVARHGTSTLIEAVPPARATSDLDLFVSMEVFTNTGMQESIRQAINDLHYIPAQANWQFVKPLGESFPGQIVSIDLLARHPGPGESVRLKPPRVGEGVLHGRDTEEAFAIEFDPVSLTVHKSRTNMETAEISVLVPHPYSWLNMKVRAAHDWLKMQRGQLKPKPFSEKHAFDVYLIVAMLQENELNRSSELALHFSHHPIAAEIRAEAQELFSSPNSPGSIEVRRQIGRELEFGKFYEGLQEALGF